MQADERHAWLPAQVVPHAPQSSGLFCRSAQTALGHAVPVQVHTPALQVSPCAQAVLQVPQWFGSVEVLAQVVPQIVFPAGQVHWPLTQESPVGHAVAQVPQWFGSVDGLTHPMSPPQLTSPAGQVHTPAVQTAPGAH